MTETEAKPKTVRRRVVSEAWAWGDYHGVTLSCGHRFCVHALGRYADCKTLSCPQCRAEEVAAGKAVALDVAVAYDKHSAVPDSDGGLND